MIECQSLIIIEGALLVIEFNCFREFLQSLIVLTVFEKTQTQIIVGWGVIFFQLTGFLQILNTGFIIFDLSVTISAMKIGPKL